MDSLQKQVGGEHYKKYKIQPIEFFIKNEINFIVGSIIKYLLRYREKDGVKDLEKAKHYIEILIEFEKQKEHV